jgi:hypothetical protein
MPRVVGPDVKHNRPMLLQETHAQISVGSIDEANYVAGLLASGVVRNYLSRNFSSGGKSSSSPGVIQQICIPKFNPELTAHQDLGKCYSISSAIWRTSRKTPFSSFEASDLRFERQLNKMVRVVLQLSRRTGSPAPAHKFANN